MELAIAIIMARTHRADGNPNATLLRSQYGLAPVTVKDLTRSLQGQAEFAGPEGFGLALRSGQASPRYSPFQIRHLRRRRNAGRVCLIIIAAFGAARLRRDAPSQSTRLNVRAAWGSDRPSCHHGALPDVSKKARCHPLPIAADFPIYCPAARHALTWSRAANFGQIVGSTSLCYATSNSYLDRQPSASWPVRAGRDAQ